MVSRILLAAAGAALCAALPAAPALASPCGDRIGALERRLDEGTARAAAASSSGQAVAAARQGQASQPGSRNEPTVPFQNPAREAQATRHRWRIQANQSSWFLPTFPGCPGRHGGKVHPPGPVWQSIRHLQDARR